MTYDYLVVGAGLAGATMAERLASQLEARVLLVDKREHLAGNAYDPVGPDGLRYHAYGPHVFHTNARHVVAYLSAFTRWRPYEHRVLARIGDHLLPIPINRTTLAHFAGRPLDERAAAAFLAAQAEPVAPIASSRDAILARVGRELYETFFAGYTRKQWGRDAAQLDPSVCGRIPTRTNDDDRYFTDRFQAMPADGYAALIAAMLDHPNIDVALGCDFTTADARARFDHVVYTGPIDAFFEHRFGTLPYRSLRFAFESVRSEDGLPVGVVNEPDESVPYTRTTDYRHLTGERGPTTILGREYAQADGEPYYPIPTPETRELYRKYATLAAAQRNVTFVGRLAEYRYYNMDQVVASALAAFAKRARTAAVAS